MTSGGDNFSYYYDDNVSNHSEENENDQERYYSKIIGKHGLKFGVQSKKWIRLRRYSTDDESHRVSEKIFHTPKIC